MAYQYNNKQICIKCVMDTSDSKITFDENGICYHCNNFYTNVKPIWDKNLNSPSILNKIIDDIRSNNKEHDFDCILGLSGGIDSSFLLHKIVNEFRLKPLVFHVDGGWNSELAVNNIQKLVEKLNLDLYTEVIDWEEMKDLQLAFFKSGVPHLDIPQDHAFISVMYKFAEKFNIKYILNGGNYSTECVRNPLEWIYYGTDMPQIRDIHNKYGNSKLNNYPFSPILYHKLYLRYFKRIKRFEPLNYFPYNKKDAIEILSKQYGWKEYPQKHFESRFTKFYEGYWLPVRFGFDTRKVQFSSLILTGQMLREEAIKKLDTPAYDKENIHHEFKYISTKLGITVDELIKYRDMDKKTYKDYKNQRYLFNLGSRILNILGIEKNIKR